MNKERLFFVLVLVVAAIAPFAVMLYYKSDKPVSKNEHKVCDKKLETGAVFQVRACKVLDDMSFEMFLENDKLIKARLSVATKDGAKPVVVDWLKKTTMPSPTVVLQELEGNYWIVDFQLQVNGNRCALSQLLREQNLVIQD